MLKCANFPFLHDIYYTTTRNVRELQPRSVRSGRPGHYTTTRNVRELQPPMRFGEAISDYTTTRNVRELQQCCRPGRSWRYYTTTRNVRELQLEFFAQANESVLYHNKKRQGTTTPSPPITAPVRLYHNKKRQGTTTRSGGKHLMKLLYHNKKRQGDKIGLKKIISDISLKKCLSLFCHGPL